MALCAQLMPAAAQTALEQGRNRFDAVLCASLLVNDQAYPAGEDATVNLPVLRRGTSCAAQNSYVNWFPRSR